MPLRLWRVINEAMVELTGISHRFNGWNVYSKEAQVMSRRIYIFSAMLAVLLLLTPAVQAQSKIGYVDSQKIRESIDAVRDAEQKLGEENRKWEQELDEMNRSLETMEHDLETYSLLLSDARKKEKTEGLVALKKEIQSFQKRIWGEGGEYFRKQETLLTPVFERIKLAIDRIADDKGLDIVFDSIQGNILFAKDNMDITEDVIELLSKEGPQTEDKNQRGRRR